MFDFIDKGIIPYISGLYTLPWILVGFIVTAILERFIDRQIIDKTMRRIGLVLLYFFIPVLIFRIFLNTTFGMNEMLLVIIIICIITSMYLIAYLYARYTVKSYGYDVFKMSCYIKTMLTNQGRSSAFIGSMMLAVSEFRIPAAMFMAFVGIGLFAVIPYILSYMHKKKEGASNTCDGGLSVFPWYLRLYPWYLLSFVFMGILVHALTGFTSKDLGYEVDVVLKLYTSITIPAALYYVGAGIHPSDFKVSEMKKLIGISRDEGDDHWLWVRRIFILTVFITPVILVSFFFFLFYFGLIPLSWFAVITINIFLPVTSTNMFLVPYGIDKKVTAHIVTWTTLICVPVVVGLIILFSSLL
ncbi:MAG: hypothetical protein QXS02_06605 [Candidatus Thermoplasmatota archaeon]